MKRHLKENSQRTLTDLHTKMLEIWINFSNDGYQKLVRSMPQRTKAIIKPKSDVSVRYY